MKTIPQDSCVGELLYSEAACWWSGAWRTWVINLGADPGVSKPCTRRTAAREQQGGFWNLGQTASVW
jgi:hypothetical protein